MKACINRKCSDKYVGSDSNNYCPLCGKRLYDATDKKVQKLLKEGYWKK